MCGVCVPGARVIRTACAVCNIGMGTRSSMMRDQIIIITITIIILYFSYYILLPLGRSNNINNNNKITFCSI